VNEKENYWLLAGEKQADKMNWLGKQIYGFYR
jgi:hypothetical protein